MNPGMINPLTNGATGREIKPGPGVKPASSPPVKDSFMPTNEVKAPEIDFKGVWKKKN